MNLALKRLALNASLTLFVCVLPGSVRVIAQQPQQTVQARTIQPAGVTGDLIGLQSAIDGRANTRATSGKTDYVGMSLTIDAGGFRTS